MGAAVVAVLLSSGADASAAAEPQPVRVAPMQLPDDLAPADRERLDASARQGLDRAGFTVDDDASRRVTFAIERSESDYIVHGTIADASGAIVTAEEVCELCGIAELSETVAALAGRLGQRLALTHEPATLEIESTPRAATVAVDGSVVGTTPLRTEVDAGTHTIEVSKPGYRSDSHRFEAEGGATERFTLTLRGATYKRWVPWAALAGGLVGIGVGAGLIAIDNREIERDCNPDAGGNCQYLHQTLAGGVTSTVIGAALLVTGVTLAVVWRDAYRRGNNDRQARVAAAPGSIAVRFAP
jgi:hypothetical protein